MINTHAHAQKSAGGVSAKRLIYPVQIVLVILHLTIIILILSISRTSAELSATMQRAAMYTQDATALLGGSSLLADTSNSFVMRPVLGIGEINTFPLFAYANELGNPRRGSDVMAKFHSYDDIDDNVLRGMEDAAESADYLLRSQLHAISLVRSVYPLPDTPPLTTIPVVELPEDEQHMTGEERLERAKSLLLSSEYSQHKQIISQNVNSCAEQLQAASAIRAAEIGRRVSLFRTLLWAVTGIIILILCVTFATLHAALLTPLSHFVGLIPENKPLDDGVGVHEVRLVASAYNEVLKRRDALDSILRSAAEKDALTGLANRYRFQQYCLEIEEIECPVAVVLFDINFLKRTNDTLGHSAGDKLICTVAKCISDCFGDEDNGNCFRFGGDEFAAVVRDHTLWDVDAMVERFRLMKKEAGVSVSLGVAYTQDISETTFKELMEEADGKMYEEKKIIHETAKSL